MKYSALFWPVELKGKTIYVLDETLLPQKKAYIKVKGYRQACRVIREMKTRAVGQVILVFYTFLLEIRKNKKQRKLLPLLEKISRAINATRPTLPFKFLTGMILGWAKSGGRLEENILGFLKALKEARIEQARSASRLIRDKDRILTHCNVSGSLALIGEFCRSQNKRVSFFVTETRPYFQGSRLTAWELKELGFATTILVDSAAAYLLSAKLIDKVIVGADQLAQNGDIANKIGTYPLAILARQFKVPFYVLCPPVSGARSGDEIKIEVRPEKELLEYKGLRIAPKGVKGYYPAFDITPAALITRHIKLKV